MPRFRSLPLLFVCLLLVGLSGFSAYRIGQRLGIADLQATGLHRLDLYATSLEREIGKYAFLPGTLSLAPEVIDLLAGGGDGARVNAYLEKLNERAGTLSIYVMDTQGKVLATSNWRRPDSFLGEDLSFRPYFREALENGNGRFFGIGTTRGEPGYYLASALTSDNGTLGVAVIKVSLEQLEKSWTTVEAPVLVADENGVVILSAVSGWKFTTLRPLDEATRAAFDHTQQYNRRALQPLGIKPLADYDHGARVVRIAASGPETVSVYPVTGRFLEQSRTLPGTPWTLTVLSHLEQVDSLAQSRAALAAIAAACLCLLGIILNERRRHLRDRLAAREALQQAHDELERKVEERTADLSAANRQLQDEIGERIRAERTLRAAQDELVQAGKLAVIGQLSTGITHELNQPLAALRTLSGNTVRFLERGALDTASATLKTINELIDRMGRITASLRSFARRGDDQGEASLGKAVDAALQVLGARIDDLPLTLHRDFAPVHLQIDQTRLEQILVNLIGNALDAMQAQPTPELWLEGSAADGKYRLLVRDNGHGIDPEARKHLFEPFFTTKPGEQGLGLGLTLSASLAAATGGNLAVEHPVGGGTAFVLCLPLAGAQKTEST